jgi:hypothetical protein
LDHDIMIDIIVHIIYDVIDINASLYHDDLNYDLTVYTMIS